MEGRNTLKTCCSRRDRHLDKYWLVQHVPEFCFSGHFLHCTRVFNSNGIIWQPCHQKFVAQSDCCRHIWHDTLLGNGLQQLYAIDRSQSDVVYSTGKGQVGAYAWSLLSPRFVNVIRMDDSIQTAITDLFHTIGSPLSLPPNSWLIWLPFAVAPTCSHLTTRTLWSWSVKINQLCSSCSKKAETCCSLLRRRVINSR